MAFGSGAAAKRRCHANFLMFEVVRVKRFAMVPVDYLLCHFLEIDGFFLGMMWIYM